MSAFMCVCENVTVNHNSSLKFYCSCCLYFLCIFFILFLYILLYLQFLTFCICSFFILFLKNSFSYGVFFYSFWKIHFGDETAVSIGFSLTLCSLYHLFVAFFSFKVVCKKRELRWLSEWLYSVLLPSCW